MSEYVSPFQKRGHDGPCHDMKFAPEQPAAGLKPIPIRVVAYDGDALELAAGELQPTAETAGDVGAVKRTLAVLLRTFADELDAQADAHQLEGQLAGTEQGAGDDTDR